MLQRLHQKIITTKRAGILTPLYLYARLFLLLLSWPYRLATWIRNLLYRFEILKPTRVNLPVVSVGNITTGGTGKTPIVAWIVKQLQEMGHRPGIISRGYRSDSTGTNDELKVLARLCPTVPHIQNPDRIAAAEEFVARQDVDILVLDDAYQHRRIHRNLNIVLLDATCPFGFGHLLPLGLLREPQGELKRADVALVTRTNLVSESDLFNIKQKIRHLGPDLTARCLSTRFVATSLMFGDGRIQSLAAVAGSRVVVMAAIGNPDAFVRTCQDAKANVAECAFFPDHHHYSAEDLQTVSQLADAVDAEFILTTLKDMVKVETPDPRMAAVMIETSFDDDSDSQIVRDMLERATMMI